MWKSSSGMLVNPRVVFTFTGQRWSTTFSFLLTLHVWTLNIFSLLSAVSFPYLQHWYISWISHTVQPVRTGIYFFDMTVFSLESRKPQNWQKHLWIRHLTHTCYWHLYICHHTCTMHCKVYFLQNRLPIVRSLSVSFFIEKEPHKQLRMKRKRKGER